MDNRDYKDFGSLLVLMVMRNSGELTMILGGLALAVGLWKFAPALLSLSQ